MGILEDHEVKDGKMMEQPVELVVNAASVMARGELSRRWVQCFPTDAQQTCIY